MITIKTDKELKLMREANRIVAVILHDLKDMIKPGVSTYELDQWAEETILKMGAKPAFKGYENCGRVYPNTLCTSINHQVVHGIPSRSTILREGDIIGVDVGTVYKGLYGDGAYTYPVGEVTKDIKKMLLACQKALDAGVREAKIGNRINDISRAIDKTVRAENYEIVRDLTGHGIGHHLHEEPQIINYDDGIKRQKIRRNMTFAIEPMITGGTYEIKTLDDRWTVVTSDGSLSAHFEHTVAVTDHGPDILTRL